MMRKSFFLFPCLLAAWTSPGLAASDCRPGVYANAAAKAVLYERRDQNGGTELRYLLVDGRRGTLGRGDQVLRCRDGRLLESERGELEYQALRETDTRFPSGTLQLAGRLIEPATSRSVQRPLVVFVHGSERTPTVGRSVYPYVLAAQGVTVFAFDKRGTGASDGEYTQNFYVLARDVVAASMEARQLAAGRYARFGLFGGSQGGWVAPLAAKLAGADFVVVGFGLVLSPLEEDAEQVYDELRRMGYGEDVIRKAHEVTTATGTVVASHFTRGFGELEAMKQKYGGEPWFGEVEGEFTGTVLRATDRELRSGSPGDFEDLEVPWRYDAVGVLRALHIPQLWVIAGEDTVAPGMLTRRRLAALQSDGYPIVTALFPDTDHGMFEFVENEDGSRTMTRITAGYFRLIADYMKQKPGEPYGEARIDRPAAAAGSGEAEPLAPGGAVDAPHAVVLFIGDGTSLSHWTAARFAGQPLAVERMPEIGLVDTRPHEPSSGRVTDSAAGATAYSTGVRTYNGAIAVGPDSQAVETVLERAEELGMATGLVATSYVTDATPAAFASHVVSRTMYPEIARQMANVELEVLLGGGRAFFDGSLEPDSANLLQRMRERYTVVEDAAALDAKTASADALLGLFAAGLMPPAGARSPTLAAMTGAALDVLADDPDGFFLMVEGSQIDMLGHDNAPLDEVVAEVLDLDRAIAVALDFRARHPETLVLVVGDHETGGLALHPAEGAGDTAPLQAHYTTSGDTAGHTAQMVPLFADGPGAERFGQIIDNAEVGRRLRALIER